MKAQNTPVGWGQILHYKSLEHSHHKTTRTQVPTPNLTNASTTAEILMPWQLWRSPSVIEPGRHRRHRHRAVGVRRRMRE
jgi:hypothetical protein